MTNDADKLRELARKEPEAVRNVAERAGGRLEEWLKRVLDEERGETDE